MQGQVQGQVQGLGQGLGQGPQHYAEWLGHGRAVLCTVGCLQHPWAVPSRCR